MAVVAALASLLLPALSTATRKARQAACLSNLRQVGLALALYQGEHEGRFPDARAIKSALGFRPWADWPASDPRAGWATISLASHRLGRAWMCPGVASSALRDAVQVVQAGTNGPGQPPGANAGYWLWRFDRTNDPVALDNFWGKTPEQAWLDLREARNPVVGQPGGPSEVELAVDVYFPATIPGVSPVLAGRAAHPRGRNRLMLDQSAGWIRDPRLTRRVAPSPSIELGWR